MRGRKNPPLEIIPVPDGAPLTFDTMAQAYLEDYVLQRYRTLTAARARVEHLREFFGGWAAKAMPPDSVRSYQLHRRKQGAESATVNRETSAGAGGPATSASSAACRARRWTAPR